MAPSLNVGDDTVKKRVTTYSEAETAILGEALGGVLMPGDVVSLDGELGAGKTRLVHGIVAGAGLDTSTVNSPTYVIAQEYGTPAAGAKTPSSRIVHIDAYRLRGVDELETIGWDALVLPGESGVRRPIVVVEWAERIERALPRGESRVKIRVWHGQDGSMDGTTRMFEIECPDTWALRRGWAGFESALRTMGADRDSMGEGGMEVDTGKRVETVCPITGKRVAADSPTYPFADDRARLADLSRWLSGEYVIGREVGPDDDADILPRAGTGQEPN